MLHCPLCHSRRIHRSKRKGIFERKVLAMMSVRPYRCDLFDHRFLHRSVAHSGGLRTAFVHKTAQEQAMSTNLQIRDCV
jgi:hypothetical protein